MSLYQYERDGEPEPLRERLVDSDSEAVRERAAQLLGRVADDATGQEREDAVDTLVTAATGDDSGAVRAAAVDGLSDVGDEAVEALLAAETGVDIDGADWVAARAFVDALDHDLPEVRMAAANALGGLGDPAAAEPLGRRLDDDDPRVRARAARALGAVGAQGAVAALEARLDGDRPAVRRAAADALAAIGTDPALAALLAHYEDGDAAVRRTVVAALGGFGSLAPVDALVDALSDEHADVRRMAVYSTLELLAAAPTGRSHEVRETVVERLGSVEGVVEPLADVLEQGSDRSGRRNAAWLLGRVLDEDPEPARERAAVDALVGALGDDDESTARFASTSLTEIGSSTVESAVVELLDAGGTGGTERAKAAFVLGEVGGEVARRRLNRLVDDADGEAVRQQAFAALSKLGGHAHA